MYSTEAWNSLADERTEKRRAVTDWKAWKAEMDQINQTAVLEKDRSRSHVVLLIGYNAETDELAFSDSWGERFIERWMTLAEAESISQNSFWMVGF
jgi:hypothetical protein